MLPVDNTSLQRSTNCSDKQKSRKRKHKFENHQPSKKICHESNNQKTIYIQLSSLLEFWLKKLKKNVNINTLKAAIISILNHYAIRIDVTITLIVDRSKSLKKLKKNMKYPSTSCIVLGDDHKFWMRLKYKFFKKCILIRVKTLLKHAASVLGWESYYEMLYMYIVEPCFPFDLSCDIMEISYPHQEDRVWWSKSLEKYVQKALKKCKTLQEREGINDRYE